MTILNEYVQIPESAKSGIAFFVILAVAAMLVIFIVITTRLMDDKKDVGAWSILVVAVLAIILFVVGIIDHQGRREHVVQATFDDSYPITQVMNFYKVQSIDGKIYTLIEKAP